MSHYPDLGDDFSTRSGLLYLRARALALNLIAASHVPTRFATEHLRPEDRLDPAAILAEVRRRCGLQRGDEEGEAVAREAVGDAVGGREKREE